MKIDEYTIAYNAGKSDAKDEYKTRICNIYTELLKAFEGDKAALKKIDVIFEKPTEEVKNGIS